jgi:hypothetical protein
MGYSLRSLYLSCPREDNKYKFISSQTESLVYKYYHYENWISIGSPIAILHCNEEPDLIQEGGQ